MQLSIRANQTGKAETADWQIDAIDVDIDWSVSATHTPEINAYRFYDDDGGEADSSPAAAQDTDITVDPGSDIEKHYRIRMDETGGASGASTDDWVWQYSKNSGSWTSIPAADGGDGIAAGVTTNLTDGAVTTNRATNGISDPGAGTFDTGEVTKDNLAADVQLTADNFTEHLLGFKLFAANMTEGDDYRLRLINSAGGHTVVHNVTGTVNISAGGSIIPQIMYHRKQVDIR
ncbi:MAG: hypothetical protein ACXABY_23240, partial [Candidatus Thorarchaeota archaeon]|jgi:hypothetical protein